MEEWINKIIQGDALETLKKLPDESVDCVITSPPYYGLRNYGVEGQIGLEKTFDEYLDKMIEIMREIKRVVKKSGTIWINFGDCYGGQPAGNKSKGRARGQNKSQKCLLMMPERFAIRCVDELGLILRNKIVWAKQVLVKKENRTIGSVMPTCLSPETEAYIKDETGIITPCKLKELLNRDIKNLEILSPTGWKKIKNVWQVKKEKTMKFQVGSSSEIECSLQHRFPISHDNRRKRYEIKEAQELSLGVRPAG